MRLFRYSYWFPRKAIVKLANRKFSYACHALGRHDKNISNFAKASYPFVVYYIVIDKVQFVWMFALMRRLVIQSSEHHQVCV